MAMFDPVGTYAKAFKPVEGGYIYYSSAKAGGKFISQEEFSDLMGRWKRVAGKRGMVITVGFVFLGTFIWTAAKEALDLPDWADGPFTGIIVVSTIGWILWASLAPKRLVRNRAVIMPPRPIAQARREARSALNWRFVVFGLLISGGACWGHLGSSDRSFGSWVWIIGGGMGFVLYLWLGMQKLRDTKR